MTKPFAFAELVARLRALVKRGGSDLAADVGGLRLDPATHARLVRRSLGRPHPHRVPDPRAARVARRGRPSAAASSSRRHGRTARSSTTTRSTSTSPAYGGSSRSLDGAPEIATVHGVGYSAPVTRRLGVRTRLLVAVVGAVALALAIGVTGFYALLGQRLSASATSLAKARAEAELSSLRITDGRLVAPEGPDDRRAQPGLGLRRRPCCSSDHGRRLRSTRPRSRSRGGPERSLDLGEQTRLYALPIVENGVRYGTLVSAISLDPYEETGRTALIGVAASRRGPARGGRARLAGGCCAGRSGPCRR